MNGRERESQNGRTVRTVPDDPLIPANEWNRGFVIDSHLIAQAAHIANTFDFDIYGSGEE